MRQLMGLVVIVFVLWTFRAYADPIVWLPDADIAIGDLGPFDDGHLYYEIRTQLPMGDLCETGIWLLIDRPGERQAERFLLREGLAPATTHGYKFELTGPDRVALRYTDESRYANAGNIITETWVFDSETGTFKMISSTEDSPWAQSSERIIKWLSAGNLAAASGELIHIGTSPNGGNTDSAVEQYTMFFEATHKEAKKFFELGKKEEAASLVAALILQPPVTNFEMQENDYLIICTSGPFPCTENWNQIEKSGDHQAQVDNMADYLIAVGEVELATHLPHQGNIGIGSEVQTITPQEAAKAIEPHLKNGELQLARGFWLRLEPRVKPVEELDKFIFPYFLKAVHRIGLEHYRAGRRDLAAALVLDLFGRLPVKSTKREATSVREIIITEPETGNRVYLTPTPNTLAMLNDCAFFLEERGVILTSVVGLLQQIIRFAPDRRVAYLNLADSLHKQSRYCLSKTQYSEAHKAYRTYFELTIAAKGVQEIPARVLEFLSSPQKVDMCAH